MREVTPSVRLIARPEIDIEQLASYLDEVGGIDWLRRQTGADNDEARVNNIDDFPGESIVEAAGRACYRSWEPGLNANVTKVRADRREYFENLLRSGHGSVLEHANYSFIFHNVSRVFTHELVRHRAGTAISQESMRFVRLTDIPFWFPEWFERDDRQLYEEAVALLETLEAFQHKMADRFKLDDPGVPFREKKAKTSFMRRFAPDGVATSIVWTANIRTLRHVIEQRTHEGAEEEIRYVFDFVAATMMAECPLLFRDFTRLYDGKWQPMYRKV